MWIVRLTDKQLEVLRALLRAQEHLGPALQRSLQALDLARWDELPEAELPWEDVARTAKSQGVSEADVVWDLCGKRPEPARAKSRSKPRRKGKARSRKASG
ncbi:MAG: hypothetical protein ACRDL3_02095 [Solirubrobacterales bacterium]